MPGTGLSNLRSFRAVGEADISMALFKADQRVFEDKWFFPLLDRWT